MACGSSFPRVCEGVDDATLVMLPRPPPSPPSRNYYKAARPRNYPRVVSRFFLFNDWKLTAKTNPSWSHDTTSSEQASFSQGRVTSPPRLLVHGLDLDHFCKMSFSKTFLSPRIVLHTVTRRHHASLFSSSGGAKNKHVLLLRWSRSEKNANS